MRILALTVLLAMLLGGCGWNNGSYVSVKPHAADGGWEEDGIVPVTGYRDMCDVLAEMVKNGAQSGILSVEGMDSGVVDTSMQRATQYILKEDPLGAYGVEDIQYELGVNRGVDAVAVTVHYNSNRSQLQRMRRVESTEQVADHVGTALRQCNSALVLLVDNFKTVDFGQMVRDYAENNPAYVMEVPQVTANYYPESGSRRVVELLFTYQTSVESMRSMQSYVQPVFSASALYVSGEGEQLVKFDQIYSFLMERNDYKLETSITPAYSLLRYGVGDSKAFATVYSAMCRRANLDCQTISGTKKGEPWFWNIICVDGVYYHVDLLESHKMRTFSPLADDQMGGYVWDYSAYPVCGQIPTTEE